MRFVHAALALVFACVSSGALAQSDADEWQYRLTPYLWLPVIDGTLKYDLPPGGGGSPNVSVGPTDWLDLLNYGALISGSARKGRYSIFSDLVYLSMTSKNDGRVVSVGDPNSGQIPVSASLNLNTRTDLDGLAWVIAGGYALNETESSSLDVFAGARFFDVDVSTSWDLTAAVMAPGGGIVLPAQGSIGSDTDLWDGILGMRGHFAVGTGNWSVPYYFDVGAGDSELTWNAMVGLAYEFGWGDLILVYRHLEYDQDSESLLQGFSFGGPVVGARFRF